MVEPPPLLIIPPSVVEMPLPFEFPFPFAFFISTVPSPLFCSRIRCLLAKRSKLANRYEPPIPS